MPNTNERKRPSLPEWRKQIKDLKRSGKAICPLMIREEGRFWPELCVCDILKTKKKFQRRERRSCCFKKGALGRFVDWILGRKDETKWFCLARLYMPGPAGRELAPHKPS